MFNDYNIDDNDECNSFNNNDNNENKKDLPKNLRNEEKS